MSLNKKHIIFLAALLFSAWQVYAYRVVSIEEQLIKLDQIPTTTEANKMQELIEPYQKQLDSSMNVVIGFVPERMETGNPEGTLSNYFTDALFHYTLQTEHQQVDLAILNFGGFRKPIEAGNVTIKDIFELMPFENEAVVFELNGKDLLELCQIFAKKNGEAIAGMRITIQNGQAGNVLINNLPIDTNKVYKIVTSDYLLGGNDGMIPLRNYKNPVMLNKKLRDIFIEYIKQETAAGKQIKSQLDGRVK